MPIYSGTGRLLSTQQITNIGDLQNAARLRENLRARDWEVIIRHARQVNARDFRSGNFVFLGGAYSVRWANLSLSRTPISHWGIRRRPASLRHT